jgi:hypothetical protein
MRERIIAAIIITLSVFGFIYESANAFSCLQGPQGGTGICNTSSTNSGKSLIVSSTDANGFVTWGLGSGSGGSGTVGPSTSTYIAVFNASGTIIGYASGTYSTTTDTWTFSNINTSGNINASGTITINGIAVLTTSTFNSTGTQFYFPYWATTNSLSPTSSIFRSGTNIGINTVNPAHTLEVGGSFQSGNAVFTGSISYGQNVSPSGGTPTIDSNKFLSGFGVGVGAYDTDGVKPLLLETNGTEGMRIATSGAVGINIPSFYPAQFDLNGSSYQEFNDYLNATTTLNIGTASTSIQISTTTGLTANGLALVGSEIVYYSSFTSNGTSSLLNSVTRALFGTTAAADATNTVVYAMPEVVAVSSSTTPIQSVACVTNASLNCYTGYQGIPTISTTLGAPNLVAFQKQVNMNGNKIILSTGANGYYIYSNASQVIQAANTNGQTAIGNSLFTVTLVNTSTFSGDVFAGGAGFGTGISTTSLPATITASGTLQVSQTSTFTGGYVLINASSGLSSVVGLQTQDLNYPVTSNVLIGSIGAGSYAEPQMWMGTYATTPSLTNYIFNLDDGGGGTIFNAPNNNNISFRVSNSNKMFLQGSTGFVGINTDSAAPSSTFEVKGGVTLTSASSSVITPVISGAIVGIGCDSATTTVDSSVSSSTTAFITTPRNSLGSTGAVDVYSFLLSPGLIQTNVCSDVTLTPVATDYVVKIIR